MEMRDRELREVSKEYASAVHFFDELTQTLTFEPSSRRQALRLLAGVLWTPCSVGA
jgi:hypothetical protein